MKFQETDIAGVLIVDMDKFVDERGFFARSWCNELAADAGIDYQVVQENVSFNRLAGTVRGMHFQKEPAGEAKVVRCTRGAILDVAVDMRSDSKTYLQHVAVELSADNHRALFIEKGCAHGFQTLRDDTEIHYMMMHYYDPAAASGVRYNDPLVNIEWPLPVSEISAKDRQWPDLEKE